MRNGTPPTGTVPRLTPVVLWLVLVLFFSLLVAWSCGLLRGPAEVRLPDLLGDLQRAKALTEDTARAVERPGSVPPEDLEEGAQLYGAARAEFEAWLGFLQGGVTTRFRGVDPGAVDERLREADRRMLAFLDWADRTLGRGEHYGGWDPLAALAGAVPRLLDQLKKADPKTVQGLQRELEKCRLRDWEELQPTPATEEHVP